MVYVISYKVESVSEVQIEERPLAAVIMNFDNDGTEEYGSSVGAVERNEPNQGNRSWI